MARLCTLLTALVPCAAALPLNAQTTRIVPGQVAERVVSAADSTQSYAAYLPSAYDTARVWPVVFIMDPRGRALNALERFRPAAERFGYILLSSYNTLSDGPSQPNVVAMNAMLADAEGSFHVDPRRYYLAGFSGTARIAWNFAAEMGDAVAGIYGAGASTGGNRFLLNGALPPQLVYFGAAGTTDFNYDEVRGFDRWLSATGIPYRLRFFHGPHAWPPDSIASAALAWFELRAMRAGLRPPDYELADSLLATDVQAARALEASGEAADALERHREIVADYEGLADVEHARRRVDVLQQDDAVRRALEQREEVSRAFVEYSSRLVEWLEKVRSSPQPPSPRDGIRTLRIEKLREATEHEDRSRADGARRQLAQAFVSLSFYEPRAYLASDKPGHALALLEVADAIDPGQPTVLLFRARAHAKIGNVDDAMTALESAVAAGLPIDIIARDEALQPLRDHPRFRTLTGRR